VHPTLRLLWFLFRIGFPLWFVVAPGLALFGAVSRWPAATEILAANPSRVRILIGAGTSRHWDSKNGSDVDAHRSYVLISASPFKSSTLEIHQHNGGAPTFTRSEGGLVGLVCDLAIACIGTRYFWIRRKKADVT
jgi:hypothetical protein